jgi:hypothetical protein
MKSKYLVLLLSASIGAFALGAAAQTPTPSPSPTPVTMAPLPQPLVFSATLPANQTASVFSAFAGAIPWSGGAAPSPTGGTTINAVIFQNGSSLLTVRIPQPSATPAP